jgi:hypothetical protein
MLINYAHEINKIKLIRSGKIKEGIRLGIPALDEHFRFKYGNFNVILGHANVGKTTIVLYLMLLYSLKHKIKWLVYSSENEPHSIIRKLMEFLASKPINKLTEDEVDGNSDWINDHFRFVDTKLLYTYKDLLRIAASTKKEWDYDGFVIDPYNSMLKDKDDLQNINSHEYDYQVCSYFRSFAAKHKLSIWLCTHANTAAIRIKHEHSHPFGGYPIPPLAADVEGGGKFVNRADDFMVIHRYTQHPSEWMCSHIHIRKVKDVDTGGRPTPKDDPIELRSVINNVGFEIDGENPIKSNTDFSIKELPF